MFEVHEPGDDSILHEGVAKREVPVGDLPRQRGIHRRRELARAIQCAVKQRRLRRVEARVLDRLGDVIYQWMDTSKVALEPGRTMAKVVELGHDGIEPSERGGSRPDICAAVLWQCFAFDTPEESRRSAIQ
jgi:hypothetical protein